MISTKSIQTPEILDRKKRKVYRERSTNPSHGVGHTGESTPETAPAATNTALAVPTHCVLAPMCDTEHDQGWGLSLPGSATLGALGCANSALLRTTEEESTILCPVRDEKSEVHSEVQDLNSGGPRAYAAEQRTISLEKERYR